MNGTKRRTTCLRLARELSVEALKWPRQQRRAQELRSASLQLAQASRWVEDHPETVDAYVEVATDVLVAAMMRRLDQAIDEGDL